MVTVLGFTLDPVVIDEGTFVTDVVPEVNVDRSTSVVDMVFLLVPVDRILDPNKGVELVVTKVLLVFEAVRDTPVDTVCLEPGMITSDDGGNEELGLWEPIAVEDVVKMAELDELGL